jgi:hypothetical protein
VISLIALVVFAGVAESVAADLELRLETEKQTYALYEPVIIRYELVNVSDHAVSYQGSLLFATGRIRFEVASEQGDFRRYDTGGHVDGVGGKSVLQPGEKVAAQVIMITNSLGITAQRAVGEFHPYKNITPLTFPAAGTHRIRARFPIGGQKYVLSDTLHIDVRALNAAEQLSVESFETLSDLIVAMGGERITAATRQEYPSVMYARWEDFIEDYPNSPYTPFVQWNLSTVYASGYGLPNAEPDRAMELLMAVTEDGPRFLADDAMWSLATLQMKSGETGKAKATIEQLLKDCPDSEHAFSARRLGDRLAE